MKSNCSNASLRAHVSYRFFCLDDLSIAVSGVLKSPTITVLLSVSPFKVVSSCLTYCSEPMFVGRYLKLLYLLLDLILWSLSLKNLCSILKSFFVWYEYCYSSFLLIPVCMDYFLSSSHIQFVCVPRNEVGLLKTAYIWILFLNPFSQSVSLGCSI